MELNKSTIFLLTLIYIFTLSCTIKKEEKYDHSTELSRLELKDSVFIPIDSATSIQKYLQLVNISNIEYLVSYQPNQSRHTNFHFYNLNEREKAFTIGFDEEGQNGIGRINPVVNFISFDSILLVEHNANRVYLADSAGTIKSKFDFNESEFLNGTLYPMASYPISLNDGILSVFQMNSFSSETELFDLNSYPEFINDLTSKKSSTDIIKYPKYSDQYLRSIEVWKASRCIGVNGERVYSFAFDNALYISKAGKIDMIKIPNSDFEILESAVPDLSLDNMRSQMNFISHSGLYLSLIFDSYRQVYYRVYLMPGDFMDIDGKFYMLAERPFKIQIIDSSFKLIGETSFEARKLNPYRMLVSKDGLLIEAGNPYKPRSEDQFIFNRFDLKK